MDTFAHPIQTIHAMNSWLVLIAGCVAAGVLLVEAVHHGTMRLGGIVLGVFACFMYLQVVLGVSTALVEGAANEALFGGNTDKAFWHAMLGGGAAILVTLSVWMRHKNRRSAAMIAAAIALFAPNLGRLPHFFRPRRLLGACRSPLAAATFHRAPTSQPKQ